MPGVVDDDLQVTACASSSGTVQGEAMVGIDLDTGDVLVAEPVGEQARGVAGAGPELQRLGILRAMRIIVDAQLRDRLSLSAGVSD